jgi:hypothetical protein
MLIGVTMMTQYNIEAIFWDDHMQIVRDTLTEDPDEFLERPMLSIGIVYKETDKSVLLLHDYENTEKATYIVIVKNAIVARKSYGQIDLDIGGD